MGDLLVEINTGIRTLMAWYRDFAKGKKKKAILKMVSPPEEAILEAVAKEIVIKKVTGWGEIQTLWNMREPVQGIFEHECCTFNTSI